MVSSRKLLCLQFLFIFAFLAFAPAAFDSRLSSPAWADSADTEGSAEGGASGSGNGDTTASTETSSQSEAESTGDTSASGDTVSSTSSSVDQGDSTNSNHIDVTAESTATASSSTEQIEAYASAGVTANANSTEDDSSATAATYNGGQAYAVSNKKKGASAYAMSADGGYAAAITGPNGSTTAYVPDGTSTTYTKGKKSTSIAYSQTGSYSVAMTKGKRAWAATGTTENVGALAAGNVKSVIKSAMSAMAMASPRMASAYASARVDAFAENSFGRSQAYGHAFAFASVERTGSKVIISVATSARPGQCGAEWWLKKEIQRRDCIVKRKVINLKTKAKANKNALAIPAKTKKSGN